MNNYSKKRRGMTIIELVVVIGIISLALPAIFGLFFITLQTRTKISILQEVKRNGDNALNTMFFLIRQNANSLYSDPSLSIPLCNIPGFSGALPYFKDKNGNWFRFVVTADDKIASQSSVALESILTSDRVKISQFSLSCQRDSLFSGPIITIQFKVQNTDAATSRQEESATLHYQTKVKLRSF